MKFNKCFNCGARWLVFKTCECSDNIMDYVIHIGSLTFGGKKRRISK